MDKDFAVPFDILIGLSQTPAARMNQESLIKYLKNHNWGRVLDVGELNPMGIILKREFNIEIDNTEGDLDISFTVPRLSYDTIIMSHVIEHLFNPLYCLLRLNEVLNPDGKLIIATPWSSEHLKIGWDKGHFHEFDEYRFYKLVERAGFKVVGKEYTPSARGGFGGIRPILKKIMAKNVIYDLKKFN